MTGALDRAIADVVNSGGCSGCGACCAIDPGLRMALAPDGFLRPVRQSEQEIPDDRAAADEFARVCPGRVVTSPRPRGAQRHPHLGSYLESWAVSAADPEQRYRGASGGALTALSAWLTDTGRANKVIGAGPAQNPRCTVSVTITDRETAMAAAGSRYAPVATLASPGVLDPGTAVVAKPCEASALARLADGRASGVERPIILSFFCAGTPSQTATDALVDELVPAGGQTVQALRYRGCGWPGEFTVATESGEHGMDYRTSWGDRLGPTMQWRCKICPDGVGESADLVACDNWEVDEQGYPVFDEGDGRSGLLVRTERGRELFHAALEAGVLAGEPLEAGRIAAVQPGQTWRRDNLAARLLGARIAGAPIPVFRGFPLLRLALRHPRQSLRSARGSWRRARVAGLRRRRRRGEGE